MTFSKPLLLLEHFTFTGTYTCQIEESSTGKFRSNLKFRALHRSIRASDIKSFSFFRIMTLYLHVDVLYTLYIVHRVLPRVRVCVNTLNVIVLDVVNVYAMIRQNVESFFVKTSPASCVEYVSFDAYSNVDEKNKYKTIFISHLKMRAEVYSTLITSNDSRSIHLLRQIYRNHAVQ